MESIIQYTTFNTSDEARGLRTSIHENEDAKSSELKMASSEQANNEQRGVFLNENDIPGASLLGRKPEEFKNNELRFWLQCRGDPAKGLKTKAQLAKRVHEYINSGKGKEIVDPDPNKIYSRRKSRIEQNTALATNQTKTITFPLHWSTSLKKMPLFTIAEMNRWKEERKFRYTASNFHRISKRVRNHDTFASELIDPKPFSSRTVEHGRRYEPIALMEYEKFMHRKNMPVQVLKCGFVIDKGHPILGASPDGRVIDVGCVHPYGIVEIKCPASKFNVTPLDACGDEGFYMEKTGDNKCSLKRTRNYYAQVQGQIAITGAQWCDFVVYTKVGMYIQRITLDVPYWEELKEKLTTYYFKHFIKFAVMHLPAGTCRSDDE